MKVIGAIKESLSKRSNLAIIRCITQVLQNVENWSIEHVPKEENVEADRIAKLTSDREEGLQLYVADRSSRQMQGEDNHFRPLK
ncbi:hypothetical protein PVK06_003567 [Gossypium arboreum]|uniref:RNase H type-1 domain-containing protein n=1 Tax=Gossypium arboreum TaxID=29729 RepID=A0ABR0R7R4_GOSAR|nr:hypothetical protein PVK06_003567 [Gossypium arboreum]